MPWTLWYHHQLIGQTSFEVQGRHPRQRLGLFRPDPHGASLVPAIAYVHQALREFERMVERRKLTPEEMLDSMGTTPEGQRVAECGEILEQLQLRDDAGSAVACEAIAILDVTEVAEKRDAPREAARDAAKESRRYMISTTISGQDFDRHVH